MTRILGLCSLLWALSAACAAASPCFAENWPGFRGPTGQGISQEIESAADVEPPRESGVADLDSGDRMVVAHHLGRPRFCDLGIAGRDILPLALP